MTEVIEDKAKTKLSATEDITSWMIRHAAFLQTRRTVKHNSRDDITKTTRVSFCHLDQQSVRKSETKRLRPQQIRFRFIPGIWLGRATESDEHIVRTASGVYTARTVRAKKDQEIWNSGRTKSMKVTPWAPRSEESQAEVRMQEERHRAMFGWNTNTRILREFWDELGRWICGMREPGRQETQFCVSETTRGMENKGNPTIRTHDTWYRHRHTTRHPGSQVHFHSPYPNTKDRLERH